jgi:hypothetical protein
MISRRRVGRWKTTVYVCKTSHFSTYNKELNNEEYNKLFVPAILSHDKRIQLHYYTAGKTSPNHQDSECNSDFPEHILCYTRWILFSLIRASSANHVQWRFSADVQVLTRYLPDKSFQYSETFINDEASFDVSILHLQDILSGEIPSCFFANTWLPRVCKGDCWEVSKRDIFKWKWIAIQDATPYIGINGNLKISSN